MGRKSSRNNYASAFFVGLSIFEIAEVAYILIEKDGNDAYLPLWIALVVVSFFADCLFETMVSNPIGRSLGVFISNLICGLLPFFIIGWKKVELCLTDKTVARHECKNDERIFLGLSIAVIVIHFLRFLWNLCCDECCDENDNCYA